MVSNGNNISSRASPTMKARQILKETNDLGQYWYVVSRALLLMTSKADKLPLETELLVVARDNNTILALKHGDQTLSRLTQLIIVVSQLHLFEFQRKKSEKSKKNFKWSGFVRNSETLSSSVNVWM